MRVSAGDFCVDRVWIELKSGKRSDRCCSRVGSAHQCQTKRSQPIVHSLTGLTTALGNQLNLDISLGRVPPSHLLLRPPRPVDFALVVVARGRDDVELLARWVVWIVVVVACLRWLGRVKQRSGCEDEREELHAGGAGERLKERRTKQGWYGTVQSIKQCKRRAKRTPESECSR